MPVWSNRGDASSALAATRLLDALARGVSGDDRALAVLTSYAVLEVRDPLLMTAYYVPELPVRRWRDAVYRYPIYGRPPDLVEVTSDGTKEIGRVENGVVVQYPSRGEIEAGALAGRGLELAWTDDPLRLFLLHVQGSGRLRTDDGRIVPVQFAGTNGRPYTALASVLVREGYLTKEEATIPGITRVMASLSPAEQMALMSRNERYTFFRVGKPAVVGSMGVELTPGRSIATDLRLIPPGSIAYIVTDKVRRFVVAQDTGAAIKGAHVDLFVGTGSAAEAFAGEARERGKLYLLKPR